MQRAIGVLVAAAASIVTAAGCGSTTPAMPRPVTEPVLDQPGQNIVRYRDANIEVVLDTTFATQSLGDRWLVLNVAFSGMTGGASTIERDRVSVRAPDGSVIPLPTYRDFIDVNDTELASAARRAALASRPLDFTRANRRPCELDFMPLPGSGRSARTALNVTKNELCTGLLFYPVEGGVQPGRWRLVIDLEETRAVVPFTLGDR
jgi:hypothetical protein